MKIAIFGGRFDPVHNGHVVVAKEVIKVKAADEVWFSLENQHQWRPIVASVRDRKAMLELVLEDKILQPHPDLLLKGEGKYGDVFKVDMTPVELGGSTATIFVMRQLQKKYPQHEFVFIVGSDQLGVFDKWTHWEELLQEVRFLVVARKGYPLENIPSNATVITDPAYEPLEDSATRIRELSKAGKSIAGLVPKKVEEYIRKHRLYL